MNIRKLIVTMAAALGLLAALGTATATASNAQGGSERGPVVSNRGAETQQIRVTPKADSTSITAASPSVYPAARRNFHITSDQNYDCTTGNLCIEVWDPTVNKWEVFFLYYCNRYGLSYFNSTGLYFNHQTTGTVARFYGQDGRELDRSVAPDWGVGDWRPVWSIRNC
jgi:hypothetical protein